MNTRRLTTTAALALVTASPASVQEQGIASRRDGPQMAIPIGNFSR